MPIDYAIRKALPEVIGATKGNREWLKLAINLGIRLADKEIYPCSTLKYGVPLATQCAKGNIEWFEKNLKALEDLAIELQPINPYETLVYGEEAILKFGIYPEEFRKVLGIVKQIPEWFKRARDEGLSDFKLSEAIPLIVSKSKDIEALSHAIELQFEQILVCERERKPALEETIERLRAVNYCVKGEYITLGKEELDIMVLKYEWDYDTIVNFADMGCPLGYHAYCDCEGCRGLPEDLPVCDGKKVCSTSYYLDGGSPFTTHQEVKVEIQRIFDFLSIRDDLMKADVMLIFGNYDLKIPQEAAKYESLVNWVVTSGYKGIFTQHFKEPEAVIFKRVLIENGVSEEKIIVEPNSKNTKENLDNSFSLLKEKGIQFKKVLLIAHPLHQLRATATARRYYPDIEFVSYAAYKLDVNLMNEYSLRNFLGYALREIRKIRENVEKNWIALTEEEWKIYQEIKKLNSRRK